MINRRDGYPMIVLAGLLALLAGLLPVFQPSAVVRAHPYPPTTASAHYAPVAWPSSWIAYTYTGSNIRDQKVQDPSNGGTSPQNYANVSSGCTDQVLPSIYYGYDATAQVIFFRWRVEQIANTYATGPSAGSYRNSDPWNAGQWTVLVDTDGDGYREFAMRLEGGTGTPDAPIDMLQTLWSNEPSHSVDYTNPSVKLVAHNPTAFVDPATGYILNYHNSLTPDTIWPNSSAETVWDYGTTRATLLPGCGEYLIDYQIPLGMLDARSVGGTQITPDTPIQMAFATANSNTNPFQKDFVYTGDFIATVDKPVPFGDVITLSGKTQSQPIIETVTTSPSCVGGTVQLTAQVRDALKTDGTSTVNSVTFYAYTDTNGNGQADDGGSWQLIATGSTTNSPIGRWTASWNAGALMRGQYLLGL
jgi:hypothetical protein